MAGRNRWTRNPDGLNDSGQVDPGPPDDCCCSWLKPKPKSKTEDTNREGKGKEYSNEIDPIDTAKNGALKEKQVSTQDQENSHGISGNMKPSSQQEDYRPQEIKKNGKYTTPNAAKVTKSKDQGNSEEENNASHGGTRPEKTISSTVEQASTLKEKEKDRIKNRQEDILEDHHKAVHKPEYNHGIHRDKGNHGGTRSDPTKSSTFENDRIKNRHEGILEDHHKAVHRPEYNHGIHRDTGPDLTKKESSSPEKAAGVQKREGKQKETN